MKPAAAASAQTPLRAGWTPWEVLSPGPALRPEVLAELLNGGQAFRWWPQPDGTWCGQWSGHVAALRIGASAQVEWSSPVATATATAAALPAYLGMSPATDALIDALPWRSDPHLARCLQAFPGLRLLRQPLGETLLAFLCSATKQIVQIKQMVALLARRLGRALPELVPAVPPESPGFLGWRLPTWTELAGASDADLRACLLGFRARHIRGVAERLAAQPGWLEETEQLTYEEARERLCTLPGVGEKVADCVLLFGGGKFQAFPVDVWILRTMSQRYGLAGWSPSQVAHFGRVHFGSAAGLAQQFLFAYERAAGRTAKG